MAASSQMKMAVAFCLVALVVFSVETVATCAPQNSGITLRFINEHTENNTFNFDICVRPLRAQTILELMEMAAWQETTFKFVVGYFATVPGYIIYAIRKDEVQGNNTVNNPFIFSDVNWTGDNSYWRVQKNGNSIPVGISSFQPVTGDIVTTELVVYS